MVNTIERVGSFYKNNSRHYIYQLTSNRLQAQILDLGASIFSLKIKDRSGVWREISTGYSDPADYSLPGSSFGGTIGRYANRISNAKFTLEGKSYALPANKGHHTLHSGPDGFHYRSFTAQIEGDRLILHLVSPDGDQGFPGRLDLEVSYRIVHEDQLEIKYLAEVDKASPINLTNHTYFRLNDESDTILDYELKILADYYTPCDRYLIPLGQFVPVAGSNFDFRTFKKIGDQLDLEDPQQRLVGGFDHNFVVKNRGELDLAAAVYDPSSHIKLEVYSDLPGLQFYTNNHPAPGLNKQAKNFRPFDSLCLEAQFFPDAINQVNFPSPILYPGKIYDHTIIFKAGQEPVHP